MKESDILHETGRYWVCKQKRGNALVYTIFKTGVTHSESVETYLDLSLAIVRADYLAKREAAR